MTFGKLLMFHDFSMTIFYDHFQGFPVSVGTLIIQRNRMMFISIGECRDTVENELSGALVENDQRPKTHAT